MKVIDQEIASLKNSISEMWASTNSYIMPAKLTGDKELALQSNQPRTPGKCVRTEDRQRLRRYHCPICSRCCRPALRSSCHVQNQHEPGTLGRLLPKVSPVLPETCRKVVPVDPQLIKDTRVEEMLQELLSMLTLSQEAFEKESSEIASRIFLKDNLIDEINHNSTRIIADYIEKHPEVPLVGPLHGRSHPAKWNASATTAPTSPKN